MRIMGIVNATPDSFWSGSRYQAESAVARGLTLVSHGASVLDIGGESTRPGSAYVAADDELARVLPVVQGLTASGCPVPLSIDTRKLEVMEPCARAGATWLNDVSALEDDSRLGPFAADAKLTVVLMHRQGHPSTMQRAPHYENVVDDVIEDLSRRIERALSWGISAEKIILDPGFGFGKSVEHTQALFRGLSRLRSLGFPVLVGTSRKSFIGALAGAEVQDRLPGSLASVLVAASHGCEWARVHDVAETAQALKVWEALR